MLPSIEPRSLLRDGPSLLSSDGGRFSARGRATAGRAELRTGSRNLTPFPSGLQFPRVGLCEEAGQVLLCDPSWLNVPEF